VENVDDFGTRRIQSQSYTSGWIWDFFEKKKVPDFSVEIIPFSAGGCLYGISEFSRSKIYRFSAGSWEEWSSCLEEYHTEFFTASSSCEIFVFAQNSFLQVRLLMSRDGLKSAETVAQIFQWKINPGFRVAINCGTFFVITGNEFWRSRDRGISWTRLQSIDGEILDFFSFWGGLFGYFKNRGLMRFDGEKWQLIDDAPKAARFQADSERIVCLAEGGIYQSFDGEIWQELSKPYFLPPLVRMKRADWFLVGGEIILPVCDSMRPGLISRPDFKMKQRHKWFVKFVLQCRGVPEEVATTHILPFLFHRILNDNK
jgi:hypothetical protein